MESKPAPRLALLKHIYAVYDDFSETSPAACRRGCAHCCTRNATLTTLEAYLVADHLSAGGDGTLAGRLAAGLDQDRFRPRITTNELADICRQGLTPPEETQPGDTVCMLLEDEACPIYAVRPFHCRCMTSRSDCGETGRADMDPFVMTVNTVFLQYIEHIDRDGFSGNLIDAARFFKSRENRRRYRAGEPISRPPGLIPNRRVSALMIPPKHRGRIAPLLQKLNAPPPPA